MTGSPALNALDAGDFEGRRGETFRMRTAAGTQDLVLVDVTRLAFAARAPESGRDAFSLVFRSPQPSHVPQAIYALEHEGLGVLELFLVPIGPRDGGMCYEAIFN
jgi:hypothetical protein